MPVGVAGLPPVFVGRARELSEVGAVIERARAGQAGALLVTGDAGVGKSALVQHALAGTRDDALVLSGGSLPLGSMSVPFLALRHAVRRLPASIAAPPFLREAPASVVGPDQRSGQASIPGLTPREREILRHLMAGRTYAEIAGALFLSEKTVSSHISNMLRKTGAANRVELAQFARSGAGSSRPTA